MNYLNTWLIKVVPALLRKRWLGTPGCLQIQESWQASWHSWAMLAESWLTRPKVRTQIALKWPQACPKVSAMEGPSFKTRNCCLYSLSQTLIIEAIHLSDLLQTTNNLRSVYWVLYLFRNAKCSCIFGPQKLPYFTQGIKHQTQKTISVKPAK
jgi:hypothetical protein